MKIRVKKWLSLRKKEHKLTRKGTDNVLLMVLFTQLSKLKVGQSVLSKYDLTETHLHIYTYSLH